MEFTLSRGPRAWKLLGIAAMLAVVMTALNLTTTHNAEAATATSVYDWDIEYYGGDQVWPTYGGYGLSNLTANALNIAPYLAYGPRDYGINLKFTTRPGSPNISFQRQAGSGPLKYGEPVAIGLAPGSGYLKYGSRDYGINLVWSSTPVYEWRIYGEGKQVGDTIRSYGTTRVGLYNVTSGAGYMVYGTRDYGINLVWRSGGIPPTMAVAGLSLRSTNILTCVGSITFRLTPVTLTNGTGGTSWTNYVTSGPGTVYGNYCYWSANQLGLNTGTWQIDADIYGIPSSCQAFLGGGSNYVNFSKGGVGCRTDLTYP